MTEIDYAVAPGEYLAEWLEDEGVSQTELAARMGVSRKLINEILNATAPITDRTSLLLERVTEIPADSWMRIQHKYQSDRARLKLDAEDGEHFDAIHPQAAVYLRSIGASAATKRQPGTFVSDFLRFHQVGSWEGYQHHVQHTLTGEYALAALKEGTSKAEVDPTLLTVWLRAGELSRAGQAPLSGGFEPEQLKAALGDLKERAAQPDDCLIPDLQRMLSAVGVRLLITLPPAKLPLFGVTRWWNDSEPVVQLSCRRNTDGFFIWTFFHELGHLLNDPRGELHYEFTTPKKRTSAAEKGANKFARDLLFGDRGLDRIKGLSRDTEIVAAARELGLSPGLIVYHLNKTRQLPYGYGNRLVVDLKEYVSD